MTRVEELDGIVQGGKSDWWNAVDDIHDVFHAWRCGAVGDLVRLRELLKVIYERRIGVNGRRLVGHVLFHLHKCGQHEAKALLDEWGVSLSSVDTYG